MILIQIIKKQILVIDDELDICIMLKVVLENNGFIVNYYSNPIVALDEFKPNLRINNTRYANVRY